MAFTISFLRFRNINWHLHSHQHSLLIICQRSCQLCINLLVLCLVSTSDLHHCIIGVLYLLFKILNLCEKFRINTLLSSIDSILTGYYFTIALTRTWRRISYNLNLRRMGAKCRGTCLPWLT